MHKYLLSICIVAVLGPGALGVKQIESLLFQSLRCIEVYGEGIMQLQGGKKHYDGRGKGHLMGALGLGVWS